jgi:hypothetical protein
MAKIFLHYDESGAVLDGSLYAPTDANYVFFTDAEVNTETAENYAQLFALDFSTVLAQSAPYFFPLKFAVNLDHAKSFLRQKIWAEYERAMHFIFDYYPPAEREGWALKALQAAQWLQLTPEQKAGAVLTLPDPACPLRILITEAVLDRLPTVDDVQTVDDLAAQVFTNSAVFQDIYGKMTGYKTDRIRLIDTLSSVGEVKNFTYNFPQFLPLGG